jgi:hypothetical protein
LLENAIDEESEKTFNGKQIFYLTLSSALHSEAGNSELAESRLVSAERAVRRARLNGVDNADIYYTESSIHALRGKQQAALDSLQVAYDRGFRGMWKLGMDVRMDSLRQEPKFVSIKEQIEKDVNQARVEVESFALALVAW